MSEPTTDNVSAEQLVQRCLDIIAADLLLGQAAGPASKLAVTVLGLPLVADLLKAPAAEVVEKKPHAKR